jgi:hypothetical protein
LQRHVAIAFFMNIEEEIKQTKFRNVQQKAILNILFTSNWIQSKQKDFLNLMVLQVSNTIFCAFFGANIQTGSLLQK